jgi:hypothetical protein
VTPELTPAVPEAVLHRLTHRFAPSPAWPNGLLVELVIGRRRRVKRLVRGQSADWIQLGLGPVRAAVSVRPGG